MNGLTHQLNRLHTALLTQRKASQQVACALWLVMTLLVSLVSPACAEGEQDPLWNRPTYEKKLFDVGQRILAANGIQERIAFRYDSDQEVNAFAQRGWGMRNTITVKRGLLHFIDSDDELAAVASHEISHILLRHQAQMAHRQLLSNVLIGATLAAAVLVSAQSGTPVVTHRKKRENLSGTGYSVWLMPFSRHCETEADLNGLDLMVKAGYNPLAMESVMTKITGDAPKVTRMLSSHPMGTERITAIHQKIVARYSQFLTPEQASNPLPGSPYALQPASATQSTGARLEPSSSPSEKPLKGAALTPASAASASFASPSVSFVSQNSALKVPMAVQTPPSEQALQPNAAISTPKLVQPPPKSGATASRHAGAMNVNVASYAAPVSQAASETEKAGVAPSVAQSLLSLHSDELATLKLLASQGYLSRAGLQTQLAHQSPEGITVLLNRLLAFKLVRQVGVEPDEAYVLSEWAAQSLASPVSSRAK